MITLPEPPPSVTVLIPAHNEESVIVQTVPIRASLGLIPTCMSLWLTMAQPTRLWNCWTVILEVTPTFKSFTRRIAARLLPSTMPSAMPQTEIVVTIDADTEIEPDAIRNLLRHFSDPRVGAVAGNVKVGKRSCWLTRWQALEYITSQNMEKRAFDLLNCITVVPGALGAWRRAAIEGAGGITADTVAEDADLTIAIPSWAGGITYDEYAIAWTEAPETPGVLIRQRFRWTFGTLQSFWKHNDTLFRPKYGTLGWIALPNIFLFQIVLPLISPVIDSMFLGTLLLWGLAQLHVTQIPQLWTSADVQRSVLFSWGS